MREWVEQPIPDFAYASSGLQLLAKRSGAYVKVRGSSGRKAGDGDGAAKESTS